MEKLGFRLIAAGCWRNDSANASVMLRQDGGKTFVAYLSAIPNYKTAVRNPSGRCVFYRSAEAAATAALGTLRNV